MKNTDLLPFSNASEMRITVTVHTEYELYKYKIRRETQVSFKFEIGI